MGGHLSLQDFFQLAEPAFWQIAVNSSSTRNYTNYQKNRCMWKDARSKYRSNRSENVPALEFGEKSTRRDTTIIKNTLQKKSTALRCYVEGPCNSTKQAASNQQPAPSKTSKLHGQQQDEFIDPYESKQQY